jgi:hypothetical protein
VAARRADLVYVSLILAVIGVWSMFILRSGRLQNSIDADVKKLNTDYKGLKVEDQAKADYLNRV